MADIVESTICSLTCQYMIQRYLLRNESSLFLLRLLVKTNESIDYTAVHVCDTYIVNQIAFFSDGTLKTSIGFIGASV